MTVKKPIINLVKEGQKTSREIHDELMFKSDRFRQKYDLRNVDEKKINNIFMRSRIKQLKEKSNA